MCGIVGTLCFDREEKIDEEILLRMASSMKHRGPDGCGVLVGSGVGLAITRLSIIDLEGGWQPLSNEDATVWVVCNGEIFNHVEIRKEMEGRGHIFRSGSDIEVLPHLYENHGIPGMLERLNGQFSFCLFDKRKRRCFLVRDRVGVHPLHYALKKDGVSFASEVKALLTDSTISRALDRNALSQVFTFWGPLAGKTLFKNIFEVPPAHYLEIDLAARTSDLKEHWGCRFGQENRNGSKTLRECSMELLDLLIRSVEIRLRADVPVGAYLSGGLDSSAVVSLIVNHTDNNLETFSIGFEDKAFDENTYQAAVVDKFGVRNRRFVCTYDDIAEALPEVVWHTEKPFLRTAPVPLFLLSAMVRDSGYKVVLTGEGADEFFCGYDIFKETQIRNFWKRNPGSTMRPALLKKLYPYLRHNPTKAESFGKTFFGRGLEDVSPTLFSHRTRWETSSSIRSFFSKDFEGSKAFADQVEELEESLPAEFREWHPLFQAQYLEIKTLLSQYLLSSQGDRVAMAHSVEVRFPFLDPDVIDYSNQLPPFFKLSGLTEKAILKTAMKKYLPESVLNRSKQPYMAPDGECFYKGRKGREILEAYMSTQKLKQAGIFNPEMVEHLKKKFETGSAIGFRDNMAFIGILTTQIFNEKCIQDFESFGRSATFDLKVRYTCP